MVLEIKQQLCNKQFSLYDDFLISYSFGTNAHVSSYKECTKSTLPEIVDFCPIACMPDKNSTTLYNALL